MSQIDSKKDITQRVDFTLVIGVMAVVILIVAMLLTWPESSKNSAGILFDASTRTFGPFIQVLGLGLCLYAIGLAISKYGTIKLGEGKPAYSNASWFFMFITAGLGSATMYWAFMEWAYYYNTPGLNIEAHSREALDMSTAYTFFHWGPIAWAMYAVAGISMAYYYYNKNGSKLSYAGNLEMVYPKIKSDGVWGRIIDLLFLFGTFGGLVLTVTVTVDTVSAGLANLMKIDNSFTLKAIILTISTLVFGLSSYIGIDKGLQKLAKIAVIACILFATYVLIVGPTEFIIKNTVNALGLEISNFFNMALSTDPSEGGSFTRDWTVFYWLYWISYLPGVAIFITRVSKGRTIRQTILGVMLAGSAGTVFFFGVLTSYAINHKITGGIDAPAMLANGQGELAVATLLADLPLGQVFSVIYFLIMLVFLASHLDATSFTIAAVSTKNLPEGKDPARALRLFWVVSLSAIPMAMLAINADLGTLKTGLVLTAIPFACMLTIQLIGLIKWLKADNLSR